MIEHVIGPAPSDAMAVASRRADVRIACTFSAGRRARRRANVPALISQLLDAVGPDAVEVLVHGVPSLDEWAAAHGVDAEGLTLAQVWVDVVVPAKAGTPALQALWRATLRALTEAAIRVARGATWWKQPGPDASPAPERSRIGSGWPIASLAPPSV